jgi:hypothetical protein
MYEANLMRVMVSLNLADIMTASSLPTTSQQAYETPKDHADPADPGQESQHPANREPMTNTSELIE